MSCGDHARSYMVIGKGWDTHTSHSMNVSLNGLGCVWLGCVQRGRGEILPSQKMTSAKQWISTTFPSQNPCSYTRGSNVLDRWNVDGEKRGGDRGWWYVFCTEREGEMGGETF